MIERESDYGNRWTPEEWLLIAVLIQAYNDSIDAKYRPELIGWVYTDNFANLCDQLDIDMDTARDAILARDKPRKQILVT